MVVVVVVLRRSSAVIFGLKNCSQMFVNVFHWVVHCLVRLRRKSPLFTHLHRELYRSNTAAQNLLQYANWSI